MRQHSTGHPVARYFVLAALWTSVAQGQAVAPDPAAAVAADAHADASAALSAAEPSQLFEQGVQALAAGQNQAAADAFNAAYAADGNPASLFNLGVAYTNLGLLNHALESLSRYIQRGDPERDAQSIAAVRAEIERLRGISGVVVFRAVPGNASVQVDGQPITPQDGEFLVAPGEHRFVVFAEGYVSYDQTLAVEVGRFSLDVKLTPTGSAQPQPPAARPAPAAAAPAIEDADIADEHEVADVAHCALEGVCLGPVLSLIGPPNLFGGGVHVRFGKYFGAGLDYQMTPSITFDPVSVSSSLFSATARVYPFGGAFFLGAGFGYQSVTGELSNADISVAADASFPAAMASIGFMGRDGFVMGLDLGVLFPIGSSDVEVNDMRLRRDVNGFTIPQAEVDNYRGEVESKVSKVVDLLPVLVQLNLLRIGYLF